MVKGVGIDIIEISRIRKLSWKITETGSFRGYSLKNEIAYCRKFSKPEHHFAGRFASKEAYSKSIGTGVGANSAGKT
ncbi:MAG: 4'-phosphopantetheinyl transferase superfamily protein [Ignavibacteria bacterium]